MHSKRVRSRRELIVGCSALVTLGLAGCSDEPEEIEPSDDDGSDDTDL